MFRMVFAGLALTSLALPAAAQSGAAEPDPDRRSLLAVVAVDALYGAAAGALVGAGVALIINNDAWGRDIMIGAGAGILVGTAVGVVEASNRGPDRIAMDGLGSPDRDPPGKGVTTVARLGGRF